MGVAFVTGADTGIGLAIAERLLDDGHAVALAVHQADDQALEVCRRLEKRGRVHLVSGDLADPDVPARLLDEAASVLGPVTVLVNNAGLSLAGPFDELTAEDFDAIFALDVRAPFLLSQHAARGMVGTGGVIVNVTSVHEHVPREGFALYAAAKAALGMLTRGMALELGPLGIRVNAVAPGVIATPRNEEAPALSGEVPLGRPGEPGEVAAMVSYLAGGEAGYVTGASLTIDGGMSQQVVERNAG